MLNGKRTLSFNHGTFSTLCFTSLVNVDTKSTELVNFLLLSISDSLIHRFYESVNFHCVNESSIPYLLIHPFTEIANYSLFK